MQGVKLAGGGERTRGCNFDPEGTLKSDQSQNAGYFVILPVEVQLR